MATVETEDVPLSPGTESKIKVLLQSVRSGEAKLQEDSAGKLQIVYTNEKTIPLSHVDRSHAHSIQTGEDSSDVRTRVYVCLEMIEAIKRNRTPSGVVIDKTKVGGPSMGRYAEGKQFERLEEVLGKGNCAGDIVVIRDVKSGTEQALKTVMISEFSTDEVRAWMDLGESDTFPSLYLFRLEDNQVVFHMEKIEHGVTLDDLINVHMTNLQQNAPELMRPFSLCMFHGLLSAVTEMHNKDWAHRDLHGGNVMVTKDAMMLKVLDFGMARRLKEDIIDLNHDALKNDILNAIRLFCGLYIGQDFQNNHTLEKEIKNETLNQVLLDTSRLADREREELLQLITMTYQVTRHPQQVGSDSAVSVMENIEDKIYPDKKMDVMRKAAAILFPDFYRGTRDISLARGLGVVDGAEPSEGMMADDFNLEEAANSIPDDFLERFDIRL